MQSRVKTTISKEQKEQILDDLARDVVGDDEKKQQEYRENIKDLPFVVEPMYFPGNQLIDT